MTRDDGNKVGGGAAPAPGGQQRQEGRVGRRAFLVATGVAAVGAGLWAVSHDKEGPAPAPGAHDGGHATAAPVAAEDAGAPDLGSEVFPDATGRAIAQATDAPVIVVPRAAWTSQAPDRKHMRVMGGVDKITVHHTAAEASEKDAWKPTVLELDRIEEFHTKGRGWADIGYHFVVDPVGRVWQARPLAYQGAHVREHNDHNLGIVLMGNFETQRPTAAQLGSLTSFLVFLRDLYKVQAKRVYTHGELGQTSCPGKALQAYMNKLRAKWV